MKNKFLFYYNIFYPKYSTQHACPHGYNTYGSNQHSLAKKEKIIFVTCITRIFKEIITLIISFASFYNYVKYLNS